MKHTLLLSLLLNIFLLAEESPFNRTFEEIEHEERYIIIALAKFQKKQLEIQQKEKREAQAKRAYLARQKQKREEQIAKETRERIRLQEQKAHEEREKIRLAQEKYLKEHHITAHIDKKSQKMYVYEGKDLIYLWKVSTAKKGYNTPLGKYKPQYIQKMHYSKQYENAPMPYSIFFREGGYAIHGTTSVHRLGSPASHGCVRLHTQNAKSLYQLIRKYGMDNTTITITN